MTDVKPIPRAELDVAEQQFCRQIAAAIAAAMAYRNMGFPEMAVRMGRKEKTVRKWFKRLIDGSGKGVGLREVANMASALDCRASLELRPIEPQASAVNPLAKE